MYTVLGFRHGRLVAFAKNTLAEAQELYTNDEDNRFSSFAIFGECGEYHSGRYNLHSPEYRGGILEDQNHIIRAITTAEDEPYVIFKEGDKLTKGQLQQLLRRM